VEENIMNKPIPSPASDRKGRLHEMIRKLHPTVQLGIVISAVIGSLVLAGPTVNFGVAPTLDTPFTCDGTLYQTRASGTETSLLRFPAIGPSASNATSVWTTNAAVGLNGLAFNRSDNFLYAFRTSPSTNTRDVYKLGNSGATLAGTVVGSGLDNTFVITGATFDSQGRLFFVGQGGGNILPAAVYRVDSLADSDPGTPGVQIAVAQVYPLSATVPNIGDIAFGPDGNLYAATQTFVYQFLLSSSTATVTKRTIPSVGGIGSAYFDLNNRFYVYENSTSKLYQVNFSFGTAFATDPVNSVTADTIPYSPPPALPSSVGSTDGASCTPEVVNVAGQVWNDANGGITLDGSETGTNAVSSTLTVYAVDSSGNVVSKALVAADGTYTLVGVPVNSTVTLRLSNNSSVAVGSPAPATPSLPTNWTNTGENKNGVTETITPGEIAISVGIANLANQNFGIEQLPNTVNATAASQVNPGGTNIVLVPSIQYTDPEDNNVSSTPPGIVISNLPSNASVYYNGVLVTEGQVISSYNPALLTVDPNDGAQSVTFNVAAIDAAGKVDPTPATVTVPFAVVNVSGTVWDDSSGNILIDGTEAGTNAGGLTVYLVDASGNVAGKATVASNGSYLIPGINLGNYTLRLSTDSSIALGSAAPISSSLPSNWVNTGENKNGVTETITPGEIAVNITNTTNSVINQNFGIEQPPVATTATNSSILANAGPTTLATGLAATDADGTVALFKVNSLPPASEGVLYYADGVTPVLLTDPPITPAVAAGLKFDPSGTFVGNSSFVFLAIDNAGIASLTPATYTIPVVNTPPVATGLTNATQTNPTGTTSAPVSSSIFIGTDSDGTIAKFTISSFPSNATSITINGTTYTSSSFPIGGVDVTAVAGTIPASVISVDPIDGALTVGIPFTVTDNLGLVSATATASVPFVELALSGKVWKDADGSQTINGTEPGTNAGSLNAVLTNSSGVVIAVVPVNADGIYNFASIPPNTDIKLQITTLNPAVGSSVAAPVLPAGYTNTTLSELVFNTGTSSITNKNFGLEQPPTAIGTTAASQPNPTGTNSANVPSSIFAGTDPDGTIAKFLITDFPSNADSITINGTTYTASSFPIGGVSIPAVSGAMPAGAVKVDPIDGAVMVDIPFIVTDNAGQNSMPETASLPFAPLSVSGKIWDDANGNVVLDGLETGTNAGGLTVYAVDAGGNVVEKAVVNPDGTYTLASVPPNASLTLRLSSDSSVAIGSPAPTASSLPANWTNTGESLGGVTETTTLGDIALTTTTENIADQNYGIEQRPDTQNLTPVARVNPGTGNTVQVPAIQFTDPEDNNNVLSTAASVCVESLPTNATLFYNGTAISVVPACFSSYDPTKLTVDPLPGNQTVIFTVAAVDVAGRKDLTAATVTMPFTALEILGTVWNDIDGSATINGSEAGINAGGLNAVLTDSSGTVIAVVPVASDGTYKFSDLTPNTDVKVLITTTNPTVGATLTISVLPTTWTNTTPTTLSFNTGTSSVTGKDFGLEQPPVASTVVVPAIPNPTGTNTADVPSNAFVGTDSDGTITKFTITDFPMNADSITINGTTYTSSTFPVGGVDVTAVAGAIPAGAVKVDPIDGATTVDVLFTVTDDAGKTSAPVTAKIPFTPIALSGKVWNDVDGSATINGSELGTNAGGLNALLTDSSGVVIAVVPVGANGTYNFVQIPPSTDVKLLVTTLNPAVGSTVTTSTLPTNYITTTPTSLSFNSGSSSITGKDFGVEQPPISTGGVAAMQPNPTGTNKASVDSSIFAATDADGTVTKFTITGFPTNADSITINGVTYTSSTFPIGGIDVPAVAGVMLANTVKVDPKDGALTVGIPFVVVDNAGKTSDPSIARIPFDTLTISGKVWDDIDGNQAIAAIGEPGVNAGGLNAVLTDSSGVVIAVVPVGADGTYFFDGVAPSSDVKVLITTATPAVGDTVTTSTLPATWTNTTPTTLSFNTGISSVKNKNFGLEQPPVASTTPVTPIPNPTGTNTADVPTNAFTGSDPDGTITKFTITNFPTNADSITVNGTNYTSSTFPIGGVDVPAVAGSFPAGAVKIDPKDGAVIVDLPFTVTDDAGKTSAPVTASVPFTPIALSGTVWNDIDGSQAINGTELGTNAGSLNAVLTDSSGVVIAVVSVGTDGTYDFAQIPPNTNVKILVTTANPTVGSTVLSSVLPATWTNTTPTALAFNSGVSSITNKDFGLEQPPVASTVAVAAIPNPTGTNTADVPSNAFVGTDPDGTITKFTITTFPTNTDSITINGTTYTSSSFPVGGVDVTAIAGVIPAGAIKVDPIDGAVTVDVQFTVTDNAGKTSAPVTASIPFVPIALSGTVWDDTDGNAVLNGTELGTNAGVLNAVLTNSSGTVIAVVPVNSDGTYNFAQIPPNTDMKIIITAATPSLGSTATASVLPATWTNTTPTTLSFNSGISSIANKDFGIEQPPTAVAGINATQPNPTGTTQAPVASSIFGGTDPEDGAKVSSYTFTSFPSNAGSITINATNYTSSSFPVGGVTVAAEADGSLAANAVTVDPIDGAVSVSIPFAVTDAAGKTSPVAIAQVPFDSLIIGGKVWDDADGNQSKNGSEQNWNSSNPSLNVVLTNSSGVVIAVVPIAAGGTYTFTGVVPSTDIKVLLTTDLPTVGLIYTTPILPANWVGTTPSVLSFNTGISSVTNKDFGLEQLPDTSVVNPAVQGNPTSAVPAPTIKFTDPEDSTTPVTATGICIESLPTNATLFYNGIAITTVPSCFSSYDPSKLMVDPLPGNQTVVFTVAAVDAAGQKDPTPATVMMAFAVAPTATPETASTPFNTPVILNAPNTDTAGTGASIDPATVDLDPSTPGIQTTFTVAGKGTFSSNPSGQVTFTPVSGFSGTVSTPYTINDNLGQTSNQAALTVTVNPPPGLTANDDTATTPLNTPVILNAPNNDVPGVGASLDLSTLDLDPNTPGKQTSIAIPGQGTFSSDPSGQVTFTPVTDFVGTVNTPYTIKDNFGQISNRANLTVTIVPPAPPVATNDSAVTPPNTPVTLNVSGNDTAGTGTTLLPGSIDLDPSTPGQQTTITKPLEGTFTLNPSGTVTFTPVTGFNGPSSTPYTITDSLGQVSNPATILVTVGVPAAADDSATTPFNTPVDLTPVSNDIASPGQIMVASTTDLDPSTPGQQTTFIKPLEGTFTLNPSGTVTFTPVPGFVGSSSIPYTMLDSSGAITNPGQLIVTVTLPPAPVATDDSSTTPFNTPVTLNVPSNDSSSVGTTLAPTDVDLDPNTPGIQSTFTVAGQGTFASDLTGKVTFTPVTGFVGNSSIPYIINDSLGQTSNIANITVTITLPAAPIATSDSTTTPFNTPVTLNAPSNDSASTGVSLNSSSLDLDPATPGIQTSFTVAGKGTFASDPTGTVTFAPVSGFVGVASTPYTIKDNYGQLSNQADLTVTITPPVAPVATDDSTTTPFNTPVNLNAPNNDTASTGATLNSSSLDLDPSTPGQQTTFGVAGKGTFSVNSSGVVTFTPVGGFVGTVTTPYTIEDNFGTTSNNANLTVTVAGAPAPIATDDKATTIPNTPVTLAAPSNDTPGTGTNLVSSSIDLDPSTPGQQTNFTKPGEGTFVLNTSTGAVTFTPALNFTGVSSTPYTIQDTLGQTSNPANLVVTVVVPAAIDDSTTTPFNTPVDLEPITNDIASPGNTIVPGSVDLDPSTPGIDSSFTVAGKGTFTVSPTGIVTFTPTATFTGVVTTPYTVKDTSGALTNPGELKVTVIAPAAPIAKPDSSITPYNTPVVLPAPSSDTSSTGTTLNPVSLDLDPSNPGVQTTITIAGQGTFSSVSDGKVTFTPVPGFVGVATTPYTINDSLGQTSNTTSLTVTVSPPLPPVATPDSSTTPLNTPVTLNPANTDTPSTGATLDNASLDLDPSEPGVQTTITIPGKGTFTSNPSGQVVFTPVTGFVGTVTTPYTINDNFGQTSNPAVLTVTVSPPPAPVAKDDSSITPFNTPVTLPIVSNDTASTGATLNSSSLDLDPSTPGVQTNFTVTGKGTFSSDPSGQVTFTPVDGFTGTVVIPYVVSDNFGQASNIATITVVINPPNVPTATDDSSTGLFNTPVILDSPINDSSAPGTILISSSLDLDPNTPGKQTTFTVTGQGTFSSDPSGKVTFTPVAGFVGTATIPYTIKDNLGQVSNQANIAVTINPPGAPVATPDEATTPFNTAVTLPVPSNDSAASGTSINPNSIDLDPGVSGQQTTKTVPGQGTFTLNPDGTVTFTPVTGFVGSSSIPYTIKDALGQASNISSIAVTVNPAAPQPKPDSSSTVVNTPVVIPVLTNDLGDLDPTTVTVPSTGMGAPQHGSVVIDPVTGKVSYTPVPGFSGTDTFTYMVCNTGSPVICKTAPVTVVVTPQAKPDSATTPAGTPVVMPVINNDLGSLNPSSVVVTTPATGGTTSVDPVSGNVTYTPNPGFSGTDTFTYKVCDVNTPTPSCTTATATVTVTPVAIQDTATTPVNTSVTLKPLVNDKGTLVPSSVIVTTPASNGTTTVDPTTGDITYMPNPGFSGTDTFTYKVCDSSGNCTTATDTIIVKPTTSNDTATTPAGTPVSIPVLTNDKGSLVNGSVIVTSGPNNGTTSVDPTTGIVTYTPNPGFSSTDTFNYKVCDLNNTCVTATATITVTPTASNDTATTNSSSTVKIPVLANDDGKLDPSSVLVTTSPTGGTAIPNTDGSISYTPNPNFSGTDTFTYKVCDLAGQCSTATVTVTVAPKAANDVAVTPSGTAVTLPLLSNDTGNLDPSSVLVTTPPAHGDVVIDPLTGNATYEPAPGFVGTDTFTYKVCDKSIPVNCTTATATITVGPITGNDKASTPAGTPVNIPVLTNDSSSLTSITGTTPPTNGIVSINPDGTILYTPNPGFSGTDTFTYTVCDSSGNNCKTATVTVLVTPTAKPDTATTKENTPVTVPILVNDLGKLDPASVTVTSGPNNGTVVINPDGSIKYTPVPGFNGTDVINYSVCDKSTPASCTTSSVTMTVTNNLPPETVNQTLPLMLNTATVNIPALVANDSDGTIASLKIVTLPNPTEGVLYLGNPSSGGTPVLAGQILTPAQASQLYFKPTAGFSGNSSFTFTATDNLAKSDATPATVTIPVNAAPVSKPDTATTAVNTPVTVSVLANDKDLPENAPLNPATIDLDPSTPGIDSSLTIPGKGTFTSNPDGTVKFVPVAGFVGTVTAPYTVQDNKGATSNPSNITITVAAGVVKGHVYTDTNGNGIQDPSEPNIPGATVTITPSSGAAFTTTTDANGNYSSPVSPGGAKLGVTPPNGTLLTTSNNPQNVVIPVGGTGTATAVGFQPVGTLNGHVFSDTNGDGIQDPSEPSLAGVPVVITDSLGNITTLTTDKDGNYSIVVPVGPTTASVTDPSATRLTTANDPQTVNVNQGSSSNATPVGYQPIGTLTGHVFSDTNGNGLQDPGEPNSVGVPVVITPVNGAPITVTTDANGNYNSPVPAENSSVKVTDPNNTILTTNNNPQTVSVPQGETGNATPVGFQPLGTVTGHVFADTNGNGVQDTSDPNLVGVPVFVTPITGAPITVTTDKNGNYSASVPAGSVVVNVTDPTNTKLTTANDPQTVVVPALGSKEATPVGFQPLEGALTGRVFNDINGNGLQDPDEKGIAGVTVTVKPAIGDPIVLTTDANGDYTVPNVPAGDATITVTDPTGLVLTTNNNPQTITIKPGTGNTAAPVGYVEPSLGIEKTALQTEVQIGGSLEYQIKVINTSPIVLREVKVIDELPRGLVYKAGSSKFGTINLEPVVTEVNNRQVLTWTLPGTLEIGQFKTLQFTTIVTPSAIGELKNIANASAVAGSVAAPVTTAKVTSAVAAVKVVLGVFSNNTVIVGRVYVDKNDDNNFQAGIDSPVPGARVYLNDGRSAVTDVNGRYSFPDVTPGIYAVRLDPITVPYQAKPVASDDGQPGNRRVNADNIGGIQNADFPLYSPDAAAVKSRSTTVERGDVKLEKTLTQGGAGYAVTEVITVANAVSNLEITDPLPAGASRGTITLVSSNGTVVNVELSEDGTTIRVLGTLEAGTYTLTYAIFSPLPPDQVLTDPSISYEEVIR
jgi:large repetitive protein